MKNKSLSALIPLLRKEIPGMIAEELVSVQPMGTDIDLPKAWRQMELVFEYPDEKNSVGDRIHDFVRGYLRWSGTEWIPESLYFELKIKQLL